MGPLDPRQGWLASTRPTRPEAFLWARKVASFLDRRFFYHFGKSAKPVPSNEVGEQSTAYGGRRSARLPDGFFLSPRGRRRSIASCLVVGVIKCEPQAPDQQGLAPFRAGMTKIQGGRSERRASLLAALRTLTDDHLGYRSLVVRHGCRGRVCSARKFYRET